jgi:hypothetical protein
MGRQIGKGEGEGKGDGEGGWRKRKMVGDGRRGWGKEKREGNGRGKEVGVNQANKFVAPAMGVVLGEGSYRLSLRCSPVLSLRSLLPPPPRLEALSALFQ